MKVKKIFLIPIAFSGSIISTYAHCPLCTAGAAVLLSGAAVLGVNKAVLGLLLGAFAISTGLWFSKAVKKKVVPYQDQLIIVSSFLLTVIPLYPILNYIYPYYISLLGDYGSLLNRTYILNLYYISSLLGGLIVLFSPKLSDYIAKIRDKRIPYQGMIISFVNLIVISILFQLLL